MNDCSVETVALVGTAKVGATQPFGLECSIEAFYTK
jgi:hypothetical protein